MQFFLIFLFAWLIQCGDSQLTRSEFQLNTSIYDGDNVIYRPHSSPHGYNLYQYPKELCTWLFQTMPNNLTQKDITIEKTCEAKALTEAVNHTRDWQIMFKLVTATPEGQLINLTCSTFGELLKYMLTTLVPHFSKSQLQFNVKNYLPTPIPFDPRDARDVEFKVYAYLCNEKHQPIPVSKFENYTEDYIMYVIKNMHLVLMGYPLITSPEVMIKNVAKHKGTDKIYITFSTQFTKEYVQKLHINPNCDTVKLLEMVLTNVQGQADFFLCGVMAQVVPPPTEKPTTVKPITTTTTTATETTALASTPKRPMETLVCAFILSHLLINI